MSYGKSSSAPGCGFLICWLIFNLTLGGVSFAYVLDFVFAKHIPWYADVLGGLVLGQFTVPGMIICWILKLCGVHSPMIG